MKKKIGILALTMVMLLTMIPLLAACGPDMTPLPQRGIWADNIYTSEYLGVRFVLPPGWTAASDTDIAVLTGVATTAIDELGGDVPEEANMRHDMFAHNEMTGANIQVIFESYGRRTPTTDALFDAAIESIEQVGGSVTRMPGTYEIGPYTWNSIATEMTVFGTVAHGRQFFNASDGIVRYIVITYFDHSESLEDVMYWLIGMNDPIPEPPAIERAEALVGTWAWDMYEGYIYIFDAGGLGMRGFVETGEIEEFEWWTEGADHLLIQTEVFYESWTFGISGDILTIDSRQVADVIFSYIRVP